MSMSEVPAPTGRPPARLRLVFDAGASVPAIDARPSAAWRRPSGELQGRAFLTTAGGHVTWSGLGTFTFAQHSDHVHVVPEAGVDRDRIVREFPGTVEPIILQGLGWQVLHASASMTSRGGVLVFCGASGSGKSTLAYAMQSAGHVQFADDSVVLSRAGADVVAWPRPFAPSLRPASRAHFTRHPPRVRAFPRPPHEACRVGAILLVRQDAALVDAVTIAPVPRARAFTTLLPHVHAIDASAGPASRNLVEFYLGVVESTPVLDVAYRPDLSRIERLVGAVVDAVAQAS
jgi:hypothetical protein